MTVSKSKSGITTSDHNPVMKQCLLSIAIASSLILVGCGRLGG